MTEVLVFAAQALIIFLVIAAVIILISLVVSRSQQASDLEITPLHDKWKDLELFLKSFTLGKDEIKSEKKKLKQEKKAEKKAEKKNPIPVAHSNVFVLRFDGDIKANQVENLREEVNAILQVATNKDEVVVVLESPGGIVSGYGLAASQLLRLRDRGIKVTACVDEVAASGGYLMAVTATQILAAPFAVIGSVGVVAQVPNFNKFLKKHDVEFKEYTAGEFKRTVSIFGEITPAGEAKFKEQLEDTHVLFKEFVQKYRPNLNVSQIATGEYWYGQSALALGLIDGIKTSDDYLMEKMSEKKSLFEITYKLKVPLSERLAEAVGASFDAMVGASYDAVVRKISERAAKNAGKIGL